MAQDHCDVLLSLEIVKLRQEAGDRSPALLLTPSKEPIMDCNYEDNCGHILSVNIVTGHLHLLYTPYFPFIHFYKTNFTLKMIFLVRNGTP